MTHHILISADQTWTLSVKPALNHSQCSHREIKQILKMDTFFWFYHINLKYFPESIMYNVKLPPPSQKNPNIVAKLRKQSRNCTMISIPLLILCARSWVRRGSFQVYMKTAVFKCSFTSWRDQRGHYSMPKYTQPLSSGVATTISQMVICYSNVNHSSSFENSQIYIASVHEHVKVPFDKYSASFQ